MSPASCRVTKVDFNYSERGTKDKDDQFANVMSPVSKKKLGRAYVALARSHSEKCVHCVISLRAASF